jgi:hypothetical protein
MAHDLRPTGEAAAKPGVRRRFWDFPITGGPFGPKVGMISLIISTIAGLPLRLAVRRGQWKPRHALSTVTVPYPHNQEVIL